MMDDRRTMRRYLGQALHEAREAAGVRVVAVAAAAGVGEAAIRRLEKGDTWPRNVERVVQGYATVLGTTSVVLFQAAVNLGLAQGQYQPPGGRLASIVTGSVDDPRWVAVSPGMAQMLGWRAEELVGESPLEVVYDEDRQRILRKAMIENASQVDGAVAIVRTRASQRVPVVYSTTLLNGGQLWVATAQLLLQDGTPYPHGNGRAGS